MWVFATVSSLCAHQSDVHLSNEDVSALSLTRCWSCPEQVGASEARTAGFKAILVSTNRARAPDVGLWLACCPETHSCPPFGTSFGFQ